MNDKLVAGADPYYYPGINVLKNALEIREAHRLLQAELAFTALRAAAMPLGPAVMGLPHLCAIHLSLFQDIYPWAGEFREIDIYKDDTQFCHFEYIENEGNGLMQELEEEDFWSVCRWISLRRGWRITIPALIFSIRSAKATGEC
ncbi:hypothetical protein RABR111495_13080 [Rahnella bruchi]